ncbi:hypothetical protein NZK35_18920 [Stieleria sp. ICT_E10.1]|nr:hypothetical protein [Stieleria sedimenti]
MLHAAEFIEKLPCGVSKTAYSEWENAIGDTNNPYQPPQSAKQSEDGSLEAIAAPLHLVVSVLIGISFGVALSVVFGIAVGITIAVLADRGPLSYLGPYSGMAVAMIPLWSLPSGVLGGLACGITRGARMYFACLIACITAVVVALGGLQGVDNFDLLTIGGSFVLVALSSTTTCCLLIRRISRKRHAVIQAMRDDPATSPGKTHSFLVTVIAMVLIAGGVTSLFFPGRPVADYILGLVAGGCWINMLCGLQLLGTYPNRARIGWAVTTISFLSALLAGIVVALRPVLP